MYSKILNKLKNCQLIESLQIWYEYKSATMRIMDYSNYHMQDFIWYNKNVNLRHRPYFYYHAWYERGIMYISDLWNGFNNVMTFEQLVIEYDIPITDRQKYESLMNGIYFSWFSTQQVVDNIFDTIVSELITKRKVPRHAYNVLRSKDTLSQTRAENKWHDFFNVSRGDIDWPLTHTNNFKCTVDTKLWSFYFKLFHNAIALNAFLFKIHRHDSPLCYFCDSFPETLKHIFCECTIILPIWQKLVDYIDEKVYPCKTVSTAYSDSNYIFGVDKGNRHDKCINFLFLCFKFYDIRCKFQQVNPDFKAFVSFVRIKENVEYKIAQKRGKLPVHFKKWTISFL